MFKFDNTHIFTGYLKQLLTSFNLPICKIYTKEFATYAAETGQTDPRVVESKDRAHIVHYLVNDMIYKYSYNSANPFDRSPNNWEQLSTVFYDPCKSTKGLTKNLNSTSITYDAATHEYLGDYLRFLRDYYDINLMSLYNCFNNKIYNNIDCRFNYTAEADTENAFNVVFDSQDSGYRIYAFPVKLFSNYTIAIDCAQGIEMFCGFYRNILDTSDKNTKLITKTYKRYNQAFFKQPFLYDNLSVNYWNANKEIEDLSNNADEVITRWDIINREQDLKLFIKVPASCKSSIVILEGNYLNYNDAKYAPKLSNNIFEYQRNHSIINFGDKRDKIDLNKTSFRPISKLQLLEFNTGESFPFADRLIEYLSNSAITPINVIPDNIKRVQKVMKENKHYFKIEGIWEDKMQKIIYDYMINTGPIELGKDGVPIDKRKGYNPRLGLVSKSTLYDILGYVDKDSEKSYASWSVKDDQIKLKNNIQNVDIYDGLYED